MGVTSQVFPYVVPCPFIRQLRHSGFNNYSDGLAQNKETPGVNQGSLRTPSVRRKDSTIV
jgi:hypothetical protein